MSTMIPGASYGGYASYGTAMPTYGAASYGTAMPAYGMSMPAYGATPTYGGYGAHPMDAATVNRAVSSNGGVFLCMCVCVFVYFPSIRCLCMCVFHQLEVERLCM